MRGLRARVTSVRNPRLTVRNPRLSVRVQTCCCLRSTPPLRPSRSPSTTANGSSVRPPVRAPWPTGSCWLRGSATRWPRPAATMADLTDVAVGVGPGPFTGLRVGVVTALTLGSTLGLTTPRRLHARHHRRRLPGRGRVPRRHGRPPQRGLLGTLWRGPRTPRRSTCRLSGRPRAPAPRPADVRARGRALRRRAPRRPASRTDPRAAALAQHRRRRHARSGAAARAALPAPPRRRAVGRRPNAHDPRWRLRTEVATITAIERGVLRRARPGASDLVREQRSQDERRTVLIDDLERVRRDRPSPATWPTSSASP